MDIALLPYESTRPSVMRLDLRGIGEKRPGALHGNDAVNEMAMSLVAALPQLHGAIALVDSPRWPSDLDWSKPGVVAAANHGRGREIDSSLRAFVVHLQRLEPNNALQPLSMFPTPAFRYFAAHLNAQDCKPHLRALGRSLFGSALDADFGPATGGIFTRFMVTGFALYRALEAIGAETYESYPDLQFRLWSGGRVLIPKNSSRGGKAAALASRIRVLRSLARTVGVRGCKQIRRLDEADALILLLSVIAARRRGGTVVFEQLAEGRFMLAMSASQASVFGQVYEPVAGRLYKLAHP